MKIFYDFLLLYLWYGVKLYKKKYVTVKHDKKIPLEIERDQKYASYKRSIKGMKNKIAKKMKENVNEI